MDTRSSVRVPAGVRLIGSARMAAMGPPGSSPSSTALDDPNPKVGNLMYTGRSPAKTGRLHSARSRHLAS